MVNLFSAHMYIRMSCKIIILSPTDSAFSLEKCILFDSEEERDEYIKTNAKEGDRILFISPAIGFLNLLKSNYVDIESVIAEGFAICEKEGASIWSIRPFSDKKKLDDLYSTHLSLMNDDFYGVIYSPTNRVFECAVERSINHFIQDGVVIRINDVFLPFKKKDKEENDLFPFISETNELNAAYPGFGRVKMHKSGRYEFILKPLKRTPPFEELTKVTVGPTYPAELFTPLYEALKKITIPIKKGTTSRRGFGAHRATTFGLVRQRKSGKTAISSSTKKYPLIWKLLQELGVALDYDYSSIHLNHNVVCPKHKDSKNASFTLLISFGDYEGGNIVVEGKEFDARHTPIIFNGAYLEHWNTPLISGDKYSLVFYHHSQCLESV